MYRWDLNGRDSIYAAMGSHHPCGSSTCGVAVVLGFTRLDLCGISTLVCPWCLI